MTRGHRIIAVGALMMVLGAFGAVLWRVDRPAPVEPSAWPTAGATLPPCDATMPPADGPCWLWDDDTIAVWPYPYAPTPLLVLGGSQS